MEDDQLAEQRKLCLVDAELEIEFLRNLDLLEGGPMFAELWFTLKLDWTSDDCPYISMPVSSDAHLASMARIHSDAFLLAKRVLESRLRAGSALIVIYMVTSIVRLTFCLDILRFS